MVFASGNSSNVDGLVILLLIAGALIVLAAAAAKIFYDNSMKLAAELDDLKAKETDRQQEAIIAFNIINELDALKLGGKRPVLDWVRLDPVNNGGIFPWLLHLLWERDDVNIRVSIEYKDGILAASMVYTRDDLSLYSWEFGPGGRPMDELAEAVRQNMGLPVGAPVPAS